MPTMLLFYIKHLLALFKSWICHKHSGNTTKKWKIMICIWPHNQKEINQCRKKPEAFEKGNCSFSVKRNVVIIKCNVFGVVLISHLVLNALIRK